MAMTEIGEASRADKVDAAAFRGLAVGAAVRRAAEALRASESPALDARVLMKHALHCDNAALIADEGRILDDRHAERFARLLARRIEREPVAYIVGRREFWGLDFETRAPVLSPRPDTETLIECALSSYGGHPPARIADLGCGSGAILISLLREWPDAIGVGVDRSAAAIDLSRDNAERLGVAARSSFAIADWTDTDQYDAQGPFDLVISNPPYIPHADAATLADDVVKYEDPGALFALEGGLAAYREVFAAAAKLAADGGRALVELGDGQAADVRKIALETLRPKALSVRNDLAGRPRALRIDL